MAKDERILATDVEMRRDDPALAAYARAVEQSRTLPR